MTYLIPNSSWQENYTDLKSCFHYDNAIVGDLILSVTSDHGHRSVSGVTSDHVVTGVSGHCGVILLELSYYSWVMQQLLHLKFSVLTLDTALRRYWQYWQLILTSFLGTIRAMSQSGDTHTGDIMIITWARCIHQTPRNQSARIQNILPDPWDRCRLRDHELCPPPNPHRRCHHHRNQTCHHSYQLQPPWSRKLQWRPLSPLPELPCWRWSLVTGGHVVTRLVTGCGTWHLPPGHSHWSLLHWRAADTIIHCVCLSAV